LIIISYIRLHSKLVSTPTFNRCLNKADKDHLLPISSASKSSFYIKFALFLFIL
jgi:hypothetical protein